MNCMGILALVLAIMASNALTYAQKSPHFIGNRTTMVHLFEWTWPAIERECVEFLGPHGFGGVQISPPQEARVVTPNRPWWERYQPVSYKLRSRSGTEEQLQRMIDVCNGAGVRIYVDVVINHMTGASDTEVLGTGGSTANYAQRQYPAVPYGPNDFNAPCAIRDYSNPIEVRNCQLSSLLDLNQGVPHVRNVLAAYMNKLLSMGVAGFRIDAAKHMWPADLNAIYSQLQDLRKDLGFPQHARPYIVQEVIDLGSEPISKDEYNNLGAVTEFKYSAELGGIFRGHNSLKWLRNWGEAWSLLPTMDALVFVDNHDNQRGHGAGGTNTLTHKDGLPYRMALVFMLAHPYGTVARIMSSYAFNDTDQGPPMESDGNITAPSFTRNAQCDPASGWICEHRWPAVVHMVTFRNIVGASNVTHWWDNGARQIAFGRGACGFVAINMESVQEMHISLQTSLPPGSYCDVLSLTEMQAQTGSCKGRSYKVAEDGKVMVDLPRGPSAMAIHVSTKLAMNRGVCGGKLIPNQV